MSQNLATYQLNAASVTARNAEYNGTPFTDIPGDGSYADPVLGGNKAGSCAPGIGINTGEVFQTAAELAANGERFASWTQLDQAEAARIPQDSQHIGGDALGDGDESVNPLNVILNPNSSPDLNDTANLVITDTAAADGAVMDSVSGAVNQTGQTVGIGDLIWGNVPVV